MLLLAVQRADRSLIDSSLGDGLRVKVWLPKQGV